jgi:hypothetical protein
MTLRFGPLRLRRAARWCARTTLACALACSPAAIGATVSEKARESGCVNKPVVISGTMYRCLTESGAYSYFNVPGATIADPPDNGARKSVAVPTPPGFPKVDSATQKGRDDVRRKVLGDELATEEKLLADARAAYADGAPTALPEEKANVEKYRERIGKLRQSVSVHEKNVEALKKELASGK